MLGRAIIIEGCLLPHGGTPICQWISSKCLSIDPLYADPTPNDPLFSVHTHPLFSTFVSNFTYKLQIFARFAPFFCPHQMIPLFSMKSYTECPLHSFSGWHLHVTFIFQPPPPPPPPELLPVDKSYTASSFGNKIKDFLWGVAILFWNPIRKLSNTNQVYSKLTKHKML